MDLTLLQSDRFARARIKAGVWMRVWREFRFNRPNKSPLMFSPGMYELHNRNEEHTEMLNHPWIARDRADGAMELVDGERAVPAAIAKKASELMGGVPICCILGDVWWNEIRARGDAR